MHGDAGPPVAGHLSRSLIVRCALLATAFSRFVAHVVNPRMNQSVSSSMRMSTDHTVWFCLSYSYALITGPRAVSSLTTKVGLSENTECPIFSGAQFLKPPARPRLAIPDIRRLVCGLLKSELSLLLFVKQRPNFGTPLRSDRGPQVVVLHHNDRDIRVGLAFAPPIVLQPPR